MNTNIYPRTNDLQTIYLNAVIDNPDIKVGDYTIYNDFVNDPVQFEKNNVLYHYSINGDRLIIGNFCLIVPIILYALYRIIRFLYFLRNGSWTREISLQPGIIKVIS